ncbi:DNA polymerase III subunit epsilon [Bifidobacterium amazonense]|uniref:DNA polymerase III subunit epsilon n=1 Tax=Bifidobacterium amazonense TaxID=2809027 RepID=A0ABS9VTN2_9BIFI|nr:DNA polymerase III subunit epsilon [Bifidobacterium amazonense]MCH9275299.1 DNA polymerase III subunit epsilon [Bifidobacterium amazonense]
MWSATMPKDADGRAIDWNWIRSLDLAVGVGRASDDDLEPGAASDLHDLIARDYAVRDRLEPVIAQCSTAFMTDFDRIISSYRLPRALAYANRRLNDEIALLIERGVAEGRWTVTEERRRRTTVPVLHATDGNDAALADIQDRSADVANARADRRGRQREQERAGRRDMLRANLGGATSQAGSATLFGGGDPTRNDRSPRADSEARLRDYRRPDWRDAYLPGRDVDAVMGIDIETTGIDPARVYIIDVGFEFMNMASDAPAQGNAYRYEQDYYEAGDAYGQSRLAFGVPARAARLDNKVIRDLTGIDVRERGPASGLRLFEEWPAAQQGLLRRLEAQPYVAHNATFEHGFFMLNVAGYAESYRAGNITIIDTMPMSKRWDPGSEPDDEHPYGDNKLDSYAKRQGALSAEHNERHLGLEDAHIMLVAMKHHLRELRAEGRGPWGSGGVGGVGGKRCGRRR